MMSLLTLIWMTLKINAINITKELYIKRTVKRYFFVYDIKGWTKHKKGAIL